ncbi:hypothetical protein WMF18_29550 [Sorangium sp. So ce315]|uniref:hypothetical protein n=1 Tax=Sorangium sp. So ce315 TaxID=3133299 RepID=UPI003F6116CA
MSRVPHRASSAKKSTSKSPRRTPKSPASGSPARRKAARPARPTAPTRRPRAASRLDSSTLRGAINKALCALLKRLADAPTVDGSGTGPAALVRLVLAALVVMLESFDSERQEAHHRAALAFAGAVRAAGSAPPAAAPPAPPSPSGGQAGRGASARPAAAHLRAIGFSCEPTQDAWDAELADLIPHLFAGEWDPVHGILQSIERDAMLILSAVRDPDGDMTPEIDMGLYALSQRARVVRTLYGRIVGALEKRVTSADGGRL